MSAGMGRVRQLALVRCGACGGTAAVFELLRTGELPAQIEALAARREELEPDARIGLEVEELSADRDRLVRTGWAGSVLSIYRAWGELQEILARIDRGEVGELRASDYSLYKALTSYCSDCDAPYCLDCWALEPPLYDNFFYEYTPGICPNGHEQELQT
jgi:hypothetical protein